MGECGRDMSGPISRRAFNRGLVWTAGAIGAGAAGMAAVRAQDLGDLGNIDPRVRCCSHRPSSNRSSIRYPGSRCSPARNSSCGREYHPPVPPRPRTVPGSRVRGNGLPRPHRRGTCRRRDDRRLPQRDRRAPAGGGLRHDTARRHRAGPDVGTDVDAPPRGRHAARTRRSSSSCSVPGKGTCTTIRTGTRPPSSGITTTRWVSPDSTCTRGLPACSCCATNSTRAQPPTRGDCRPASSSCRWFCRRRSSPPTDGRASERRRWCRRDAGTAAPRATSCVVNGKIWPELEVARGM